MRKLGKSEKGLTIKCKQGFSHLLFITLILCYKLEGTLISVLEKDCLPGRMNCLAEASQRTGITVQHL